MLRYFGTTYIFDFHFIKKNQLKSLYQLSNEIIQREEEIIISQRNNETTNKRHEKEEKKIRQEILKQKQEIDEIKREKDSQIEQLEQTFIKKIDEIQKEKDSQIERLEKTFIKKIDEIKRENEQIFINKIDEIKREKDSQIERLEQTFIKKIDEIKRENKQIFIKKIDEIKRENEQIFINKIDKIKSENDRKNSQQQEEIRKLTKKVAQQASIIDQLNDQIKELLIPRVSRQFINKSNPKGIISLLNKSVTLSAGGKHDSKSPLSNIKINNNDIFFNYSNNYKPNSEADSYIKFDFGPNNKIELSSYFIRSNGASQSSNCHPKSWRVEGSNDESHWTQLDHRVNNEFLNGRYKQHHFECQENKPGDKNYRFRFIRWIQEDSWHSKNRPYNVYIAYFELYGEIFDSE